MPVPRSRGTWGLFAWRLGIATSALTGVALASMQYDVWWTALSQLASLVVGVGYLVLACGGVVGTGPRRAHGSAWFRGAAASTMVLVALAFLAMQHGNLLDPYSVFEHMLTPALVVADRVAVRADRRTARWWHPWSWLVPPAVYLACYVALDLGVYVDLDPSRPLAFTTNTLGLLGLLLTASFVLHTGAARRAPGPVSVS